LEIKGAIVTIDAMGCQKNIAATIIENEADYVLALKGNQTSLHKEVQTYFEAHQLKLQENTSDRLFLETVEKEHGRIETRSYFQIALENEVLQWVPSLKDWKGIQSLVVVKSQREVGEKSSSESRYYISSLSLDVRVAAEAVRGHWGVENSLHWVLDVVFGDDKSRIRKDYAPQNFNLIKKLTINALKQESTRKSLSLANKRALAAMDNRYLEKLIAGLS
jgi:predicted transposase YbfD/YdcC